MSGWEEDGPGGGSKKSIPDQLLLFSFSSSNTWLLADDPTDQPEYQGESQDESSCQGGTKGRRKDGWDEDEQEGKEPEEKAEDGGVEGGMARHKTKPGDSEDKSPGRR